MNKKSNDALNLYVEEQEKNTNTDAVQQQPAQQKQQKQAAVQQEFRPANKTAEMAREQRLHGRDDLPTDEIGILHYKDNLGWLKIPIDSLPTQGLFYPEGTEISIRAARGAEIKHWSTMNDQDINQIGQVDDILNYIIERCVTMKVPGVLGGNWKDLKDIDRFYLLLAIREFTFLDGDNELMVPVSEGKDIPVTKEMIDFIKIPDEIMKFYSPEDRCFVFNLKDGKVIKMYIPSLGVTQWLKNYAQNKAAAREGFDTDFILYAPMLIHDFRRLSQRAYEQMVSDSAGWSVKEWSLVSYVRDLLSAAAEPKLKYQDENGAEVTIPLTFRGGIKSLFTVQGILDFVN